LARARFGNGFVNGGRVIESTDVPSVVQSAGFTKREVVLGHGLHGDERSGDGQQSDEGEQHHSAPRGPATGERIRHDCRDRDREEHRFGPVANAEQHAERESAPSCWRMIGGFRDVGGDEEQYDGEQRVRSDRRYANHSYERPDAHRADHDCAQSR
jgi:hypothetical protein